MEELTSKHNTPIPDISYLKEMVGDDKETIKEIILLFLEQAPIRMKTLRESAEAGDHAKLKTISHSLITELTTVGILSVVNDLKRINTASRDMDDLNETVDRIVVAVNEGMQGLKTLI
jgi:HPt (histidine-containing phosphotransfer) domain-containing protein